MGSTKLIYLIAIAALQQWSLQGLSRCHKVSRLYRLGISAAPDLPHQRDITGLSKDLLRQPQMRSCTGGRLVTTSLPYSLLYLLARPAPPTINAV